MAQILRPYEERCCNNILFLLFLLGNTAKKIDRTVAVKLIDINFSW